MKALASLFLALHISTSGHGQSVSMVGAPQYRHSDLKKKIGTAHTPEDFDDLSKYFQAEEEKFRKKAEDEKRELNRHLATRWEWSKYPTPADNARGLAQYYAAKAAASAQLAQEYHLRAISTREATDPMELKGKTRSKTSEAISHDVSAADAR